MAIVGLGNPGPEYEGTRHNAGYRVTEALARELSASRPFRLQKSICATAVYVGSRLILVQPITYMNLSGQAVVELFRRYRLAPENLLLIHDELDLPLGSIRFKLGGSSAGHQGVQSVIDSLGNSDFLRLRFGIGRPPVPEETVAYVLGTFTQSEQDMVDRTVQMAVKAIKVLIKEGLAAAMNQFN